ncbi:hypothetical protein Leryth_026145 [Lithospermum erythrorhizon]|nr:hypothetical protein Leryth_026145 [Lithospermum erythrorhizon]
MLTYILTVYRRIKASRELQLKLFLERETRGISLYTKFQPPPSRNTEFKQYNLKGEAFFQTEIEDRSR